jgi:nuclear GTP-binding protein
VAEVLRRVPAKQLQALYKVPAFKDVDQFLQHIAAARGKLKKGGVADTTVSGAAAGG